MDSHDHTIGLMRKTVRVAACVRSKKVIIHRFSRFIYPPAHRPAIVRPPQLSRPLQMEGGKAIDVKGRLSDADFSPRPCQSTVVRQLGVTLGERGDCGDGIRQLVFI